MMSAISQIPLPQVPQSTAQVPTSPVWQILSPQRQSDGQFATVSPVSQTLFLQEHSDGQPFMASLPSHSPLPQVEAHSCAQPLLTSNGVSHTPLKHVQSVGQLDCSPAWQK